MIFWRSGNPSRRRMGLGVGGGWADGLTGLGSVVQWFITMV